MNKKFLITAFALTLAVNSIVFAQDGNKTPNSGDDFDIRQNAQGGITITGYHGDRLDVVIPDTISKIKVTEIADEAFLRQSQSIIRQGYTEISMTGKPIKSIVIPNTITKIGESAFENNSALVSVTLPNAITIIPKRAFYGCSLSSVAIPNSVTTIAVEAFKKNQLTSVTFGNSIAEIGESAFEDNKLVALFRMPTSLRSIYKRAFANNNLETVIIPNGVTIIMAGCFTNNPVNSVVIPQSLAVLRENPASMYPVDEFYVAGFALAFARNKYSPGDFIIAANVDDRNLNSQFARDFIDFYKSQNKKAGTYSYDGRLWSWSADYDKAIAGKEKTLLIESGYSALFNNNNPDQAIVCFTQAIQIDPNYSDAYYFRAGAYNGKKDYDKAIADYNQMIRINPKNGSAYSSRAYSYNQKGDYDKAITDCNEAIRINPDDISYYLRGFAYMQKGNFTQARADVNMALQLSSDWDYQDAKDLDTELKKKGF